MYTRNDVTKLIADIHDLNLDPPLVIGDTVSFGLEVDLLDPVTGHIITACRPHRQDIGETEIRLTAAEVAAQVAGLRLHKLQVDRAPSGARKPDADGEKSAE